MKKEELVFPEYPRENPNTLSSVQIAEILPHRYPFVMIDSVLDYEPGLFAVAKKCLSINEPFFAGHFPGMPVMPGVLILEALAQTGAIALLTKDEFRGKIALFGGVKNCRFRTQAVPGDVLELHCRLVRFQGQVGIGEAEAFIDGKRAANAELTFAVADRG